MYGKTVSKVHDIRKRQLLTSNRRKWQFQIIIQLFDEEQKTIDEQAILPYEYKSGILANIFIED